MSKYHSTFSRREFLKILGLGGAGLGAAAVTPPVFHDLDEIMAAPQADWKRPSWVKEVSKPAAEIDWNMLKRFDYREVVFSKGFAKVVGPETVTSLGLVGPANAVNWIKQGRPGFSMKDYALSTAASVYAFTPHSFLGFKKAPTPETLGVPKWEGEPEENARMVRTAMRAFGADDVAYVELDTDTTEKLLYSFEGDNRKLEIKDVPVGEETETTRVLPKAARWVIVYTIKMSYEMVRRLPAYNAAPTVYMAYQLGPFLQDRFQEFIRILGYSCYGEYSPNALGTSVGLGVMGGLGELSRIEHLITPTRGLSQRVFKMITDLPLAPTSPINTGVAEFCRTCKKCAEVCPAKAITVATEPSWEVPGTYKNPGVKGWFRNEPRCLTYWRETSTGCGYCLAQCPLNRPQTTSYFSSMRRMVASTKVMNRTFRKTDDLLGWGARTNNDFWDIDMPTYGWD
jgi:epoxyqueuosine reductase